MSPVDTIAPANPSQYPTKNGEQRTGAAGADIGGDATPVAASANVVGKAITEGEGYPISWGRFIKYAVPATLIVVALCWLYLVVRYA